MTAPINGGPPVGGRESLDQTQSRAKPDLVVTVSLITMLLLGALLVFGGRRTDQGPTPSFSGSDSPIQWTAGTPPPAVVQAESLVATANGFAFIGAPVESDAALWHSIDGVSWAGMALHEQPSAVVADGDGLVVYREYRGARLGWDGRQWVEEYSFEMPTFARIGYLSARPAVVAIADGMLLHSVERELYYSADQQNFELVIERGEWWDPADDIWERFTAPAAPTPCRPLSAGSPDYPPVVATPERYVAFVPLEKSSLHRTWPVCDPQVWVSADGREWLRTDDATGFEEGSFVYEVAGNGRRYIAVGGRGEAEPTIWESSDAIHWSVLEWAPDAAGFMITDVTASELGFVVLGQSIDGTDRLVWFSPDGRCWYKAPGHVQGVSAAVGTNRVLLAGRQFSPDLGVEIWVGKVTAAYQGSCD